MELDANAIIAALRTQLSNAHFEIAILQARLDQQQSNSADDNSAVPE